MCPPHGKRPPSSPLPAAIAALATCKKHKAKLIIAKLDRLSRSVAFIATMLERSKVDFVCVDNPHANKTMIHFIAVTAEFERDAIADRTRKALAVAKARGKQIGNPDLGKKNKDGAVARAEAICDSPSQRSSICRRKRRQTS